MNECCEKYPEVKCGSDDARSLAMMQENYAAESSEMTAVCTYLFNRFVFEENCPSAADAFEKISITEMKHLELFGHAIVVLGGVPVFADRGRYWTGKNVCYAMTVREALRAAICAEEATIKRYTEQAERTCNSSVRALLERIICDEKEHIRIFEQLLSCC